MKEFRTVKAQEKSANGFKRDSRPAPARATIPVDKTTAAADADQAVSSSVVEAREDKQTTAAAILAAATDPQVPQSLRRAGNKLVGSQGYITPPPLIQSFNEQVFHLLA